MLTLAVDHKHSTVHSVSPSHLPIAHCVPATEAVPVLDAVVFAKLAADLQSRSAAIRVVATFRNLLPQRIRELHVKIAAEDTEAASTILLGLNVGASMVGARRLEVLTQSVLTSLGQGRGASARMLLTKLSTEGVRFYTDAAHAFTRAA
ncbi:hypothetical protein [Arthrobacter roseus]|uniref:hypothetical protein n=1 Tax=Arthrobacter roseus TaxID=136274 RepID=UPI0019635CA0|nr:hypothetical protein [Arthrobacter roseus]MBM7849761.1 hypothetical protein [Arthrobacter roseus]